MTLAHSLTCSLANLLTFSLYVHYPFCIHRCPYCGFATAVERKNDSERYRSRLLEELRRRAEEPPWQGGRVSSIYFGGGTPSLMPPEFCSSILQFVNSSIPEPTHRLTDPPTNQNSAIRNPQSEITLEANPGTRDAANFSAFRQAGVNRLSIGAQSFHPSELRFLKRAHSVDDIGETVRMAREAGFNNVSLDLIYGVPGQTVDSFRNSVLRALDLGIDHLSTYTLSIEEGTPFASDVKEGKMPAPNPDFAADQYAILIDMMRDAGFEHYELTNYAKPDKWSRHNFAYWQRTPYLGLGLGAHSFDGRRRFWNSRDSNVYCETLTRGEYPIEGWEDLDEKQEEEEGIYLSLRTRAGIAEETASNLFNTVNMASLLEGGFIRRENGRFHIAESHWLLLDEIVLRLLRMPENWSGDSAPE